MKKIKKLKNKPTLKTKLREKKKLERMKINKN